MYLPMALMRQEKEKIRCHDRGQDILKEIQPEMMKYSKQEEDISRIRGTGKKIFITFLIDVLFDYFQRKRNYFS